MNKHFKILAIGLVAACSLFFVSSVQAMEVSTDYVPLTTVPGLFKENVRTNPVLIIKNLYGFAIGIGSIIAVVMIIYAGFEYMYKESITGKSDAKERIYNAFLGLAVILGSYILLRTINPALVDFDVRLPGGSGRVASIQIAQSFSDAARAQTREALNKSAVLRSEIAALEEKAETLKSDMESRGTEVDPTEEERVNAEIAAIQKAITEKKILDSNLRTQADVGTVTTSIDENIYLRASGLTKSSDNLSAKHTSALNFFDKQINDLKTLDQSNPDVKKAIEQVIARKNASVEEFNQQARLEKALIPFEGINPAARQADATRLIADIQQDMAAHSKNLRDAGLVNEARQYEERAKGRISALCGANLCGN